MTADRRHVPGTRGPGPAMRERGPVVRRGGWTLRSRRDRVSLRIERRAVAVSLALLVTTSALGAVTLTTGEYVLSVPDVLRTLIGDGPPGADFIVTTLRLPRLLTGLLVGAALGVSGAVFQRISGNPLGSPDIIGFTTGSATGAVLVIVLAGGGAGPTAIGAIVGGLGTALAVYLLAYRAGVPGLRLILVGIGIGAMLLSVNYYLITRASLQEAIAAQVWLIGSLNGRGWQHVYAVGVAVAALVPLCVGYARRLALLEMGDDAALGLGVPVRRTRLVLVLAAVGLVAVATAASGPVTFVALAAPQLARRLTGSAGPGLLPAAAMGALVLVASDLAAQRVFAPTQLPVGVATGAIGGLYLIWLLGHEWRRGRP